MEGDEGADLEDPWGSVSLAKAASSTKALRNELPGRCEEERGAGVARAEEQERR